MFGLAFGGGKSTSAMPARGVLLTLGDAGIRNAGTEVVEIVSIEPIAVDDGLSLLGARLARVDEAHGEGVGIACGPFPPVGWPAHDPEGFTLSPEEEAFLVFGVDVPHKLPVGSERFIRGVRIRYRLGEGPVLQQVREDYLIGVHRKAGQAPCKRFDPFANE